MKVICTLVVALFVVFTIHGFGDCNLNNGTKNETVEERIRFLEVAHDANLEQLLTISAKRTCQEYYDNGERKSGYYYIDPDGETGSIKPVKLYCNMTAVPGYGTTEIEHDTETRTLVNGCEDPGCYQSHVTYDIPIQTIRAIMNLSDHCRQFIKYECQDSMLFSYEVEAWWESYEGESQYYWGGADPDSKMCACGKAGNCSGNSTTCNCDLNDKTWREDSGYFDNITTLPVSALSFGDTEAHYEMGYHTLGRLQCYGFPIGDGTSCAEIKKTGKPSGNYVINPQPLKVEPFKVYCDMEEYPGTGVTVIHHNKESQVYLDYSSNTRNIEITYNYASIEEIVALIDISLECTQYISWQCYGSGFLQHGTYWKSRTGEHMKYWGGAKPDHTYYCGCGEVGTCYAGYNYKCNCDYTTSTSYIDAGDLVDKSTLPVTGMYFYMRNGYHGYHILGPLKCFM